VTFPPVTPILHVGDFALSSWSMRPWLALKAAGLEFETRLIALDRPETHEALSALTPLATVPVLELDGGVRIPESLAVCEWAAEQAPGLWPSSAGLRALARSAAAAMASGFYALRRDFPMELRIVGEQREGAPEAYADLKRAETLWAWCRSEAERLNAPKGAYLFGDWSIADAMYTPVATRVRSYALPVSDASAAYCAALMSHPAYLEWEARAYFPTS